MQAQREGPGKKEKVHDQTIRWEASEEVNHPRPELKDGAQVTVRSLWSVFQQLQI